jgi:hypothetical protein
MWVATASSKEEVVNEGAIVENSAEPSANKLVKDIVFLLPM